MDNQNVDISLPDFSETSVLVVGDLMLDRYWSGDTHRISPEAPIPILKVTDLEDRIGGAGNVALNIASLGCQCTLLAIAGEDAEAQVVKDKLSAAEVKLELVQSDQLKTITKLRVMSRHQQMIRLDFEEPLNLPEPLSELSKRFKTLLAENEFGAIIFSDYAKGTLSDVQEFIKLAQQNNIPCLVDPKGSDFSKYKGATLLTPNRAEFETVGGKFADEATLQKNAQSIIEAHNLSALLVTRSEEGMTIFKKDSSQHFPALASEVFDVTGAGDTVIATLASSLASGCSLNNATAIANYAASVVVAKLGTAAISFHELENGLHNKTDSSQGLLLPEQLKKLVEQQQSSGIPNSKIVMTNGCFDIIHAGHIKYLEEAKNLGSKLIVAVNSDDSVKRLKGDARPINTLERRMQVLAGLESVDWVVSFNEDTPADLVSYILPDILVKGGDWDVSEIAGGEAVIKNGGKVMSLSFKEGHSTTAIIDLIKEKESY